MTGFMFALVRRLQRQIFIWLYSLSRGIKRDLAVRYFPHERPDAACRKLKFEIAIRLRLRQRLRKLQPNDLSKVYSDSEILAIKKYPGVLPFVPLIIILIETCLTFYSWLSSESAQRQLPVCAFQTNPMACDRLPECVKRIESRQAAELRFPNKSFETPSPYITLESNTLSQKTEEKRKFIKNEIIALLKKKLLGFCFLALFPIGRRCVADAVPAVSLWSMWMVWTIQKGYGMKSGFRLVNRALLFRYRVLSLTRKIRKSQAWMPYLRDVPHFTGIMIHPGSSVINTRDCILVGFNTMRGYLTQSKMVLFFNRLHIPGRRKQKLPRSMYAEKAIIEMGKENVSCDQAVYTDLEIRKCIKDSIKSLLVSSNRQFFYCSKRLYAVKFVLLRC